MLDRGAGHLHPLDYALGLARAAAAAGVRIFEGSRVGGGRRRRCGRRCGPAAGAVRARFVVVAGNGYLGGLVPEVAARVMPINNFIVATAPLGAERARALIRDDVAVADSRFVVNYFRLSADHRLLFGGGESYGWRFPRDIAGVVRPRMLAVFPQLADAAHRAMPGAARWRSPSTGCRRSSGSGPTCSPRRAIPGTGWRWRRWRAS